MKTLLILASFLIVSNAYGQKVILEGEEAKQYLENGGSIQAANAGQGCFQHMLGAVQQGMQTNFQNHTNEANALLGIADAYYKLEMQCKNDIAQISMDHAKAVAEHEALLAQLPNQIKDQRIAYEKAVSSIQRQCEQSSGELFREWKGVIADPSRPLSNGLKELIGFNQTVNDFQELFYDDCIASKSNIKDLEISQMELNNNIQKLRTAVDVSAKLLASNTKNMSYKQGIIEENCIKGEQQIEYQEAMARNTANAADNMAKTSNFFNVLGGVSSCIFGRGNEKHLDNPDATGTSA